MSTPSLQQPRERTREQWIEVIDDLMEVGQFNAAKRIDEEHGIGYFQSVTKAKIILDQFITQDPAMIKLKEQVLRMSEPTVVEPVLIMGETGTGKELLARALHADKKGNFIEINCAGLPEHLIESELFGYEEGSFTGASKGGRPGLIELAGLDKDGNAARGTLFLDEIGELPLGVQAKLLRVLNDKGIRRVGGHRVKQIDFRLVCATHQPIDREDYNNFRRDLYHRISVIEFRTTPLRDRQGDIQPIVWAIEPKWKDIIAYLGDDKNNLGGNVRDLQKLVKRYQLGLL